MVLETVLDFHSNTIAIWHFNNKDCQLKVSGKTPGGD